MSPRYLDFLNGGFIAEASPKVQLVIGGGLMTTPGWAYLASMVEGVTLFASMIAAVCGAIIGVRGVYKMILKGE